MRLAVPPNRYSKKERITHNQGARNLSLCRRAGAVLALYAVLPNYSSNFLYAYGFTDSQISLLLVSAGSAVLGGVLLALEGAARRNEKNVARQG